MSADLELETEQQHVDRAYERLESLRSDAVASADRYAASHGTGHAESLWERDMLFAQRRSRVVQLTIGDDEPLVFGRIDTLDQERFYVGRVGVLDEHHTSLVVDWRAPAAEAFYRATPGDPKGVIRRRHLHCRGRRVLAIDDELLDTSAESDGLTLVGEAALLRAVGRERTGRMRDIVATIQVEQDRIIRAPMEGILVVQGGPGTGKTAVALHRAAYLLYTYRARLERMGVLLVGPDPVFLRYVEQVLPSLGERSVRLSTAAELVDGVRATGTDTPKTAAVKGDTRMVKVLRRAMRDRQRGVREPVRILYDRELLELTPEATADISKQVGQLRGTHNEQRRTLVMAVLFHFVDLYRAATKRSHEAGRRGPAPWGSNVPKEERTEFFEAMLDDDRVVAAMDEMWPVLTPQRLVRELFASREALAYATRGALNDDERDALARPADAPWTPGDVALLDEARVLLGSRKTPKASNTVQIDEEERWGIERMLDDLQEIDPIIGMERGWLAEKYLDQRAELDVGRDTLENRKTFGHVIVDEAQDLSPMQWRMIGRRCPAKSMTIVGDLAQATGAWVPSSWTDVLDAVHPRKEPTVEELTINYRTPSQIMDVANRVLGDSAPGTRPRSVRDGDGPPEVVSVSRDVLASTAVERALAAADEGIGTVAIIAPSPMVRAIYDSIGPRAGRDTADLDADIVVVDPKRAKGLEFDVVIVVEPSSVQQEAGTRGLYVSMTRPTQRLVLIHADRLPEALTVA